jgi:hypothetical protein
MKLTQMTKILELSDILLMILTNRRCFPFFHHILLSVSAAELPKAKLSYSNTIFKAKKKIFNFVASKSSNQIYNHKKNNLLNQIQSL